MIKVTRVANTRRFAACDDRFPKIVGYGDSPDEAVRALDDKLPRRAPPPPSAPLLPLAPAHGMYARDREERDRSEDALDRAYRVGGFESDRRRH